MDDLIAAVHERFRRANDELAQRYDELAADGALPFICECGDDRCTRVLALTRDEYAGVSGLGGAYAILPGHEVDGERVLDANDRFAVAEHRDVPSRPRT